jgi:dipeptidase D
VTVNGAAEAEDAWTQDGTRALHDLLAVVPSGPLAISPAFQRLVETSTSLGEARANANTLTLHSLSCSSNDSALPGVIGTLDAAARLAGGSLEVGQSDPSWPPKLDSPALAVCRRVYERLFGQAPIVTAVHAWLETAVIGDRVSGLDMVSFGPQIEAPHSPDERVSIPTVERFWRLLAGVVDDLSAVE